MRITTDRLKNVRGEADVLALYDDIRQSSGFADCAQRFMHYEDSRVARNALWTLTKASNQELSALQPMLHEFIDLGMNAENPAVKRLALTIVERLKISVDDLRTDFLNYCLEHMTDVEEQPSIQSLCMKIAFRLCRFYPELMGEFMRTLEAMEISYYTAAAKCVRSKILSGKRV